MIILGEISAALAILAAVPYIYEVFTSTVRPERATWFVWTTLIAISLFSQIAAGGHESLGLVIGDLIATGAIFIISLLRELGG